MFRLAAILVVVLSATAVADPPAPAPAPAPASRSKIPLRVVRVVADTEQAVLFDRTRNTNVTVVVGSKLAGYTVEAIDEDEVTLSGNNGAQIILAAPVAPDARPDGADAKSAGAPVDPYADVADEAHPRIKPSSAPATATASTATPPTAPTSPTPTPTATAPATATPTASTTTSTAATASTTTPTATTAPTASTATPTAATAPTASTTTPTATTAPTVSTATPTATTTASTATPPTAATATPTTPTTGAPAPIGPAAPVVEPTGPQKLTLARKDLDAALDDFGGLIGSVHGELTPSGARIASLTERSLFARVGLRAGDVVTAVDGKPLRTLDDAADLYARGPSAKTVTVQVVRGGKPLTLEIAVR